MTQNNPSSTANKTLPAYLALGTGIFALSFSAMFVRWSEAPGPVLAFYRLFFSTFLLIPFFIPRARTNPATRSWAIVFPLLAGIFTAGDLGLWATSVTLTTASNATLLGNTAPLWVALGAWLILKQKLTPAFWYGLVIALLGAALIMGTDFIFHPRFGIGDVLSVASGLFYGGYLLCTEKSRARFDPISHIWIVGVSASISLLVMNMVLQYPLTGYPTHTWLIFLATAIVSQLVGYMLLAYALGHLPASVVSPTLVLQPVVTTLLAIPLLHETPTIWHGIGGMTALVGVYIVNESHNRKQMETPNA